jgi:hypothetical protein
MVARQCTQRTHAIALPLGTQHTRVGGRGARVREQRTRYACDHGARHGCPGRTVAVGRARDVLTTKREHGVDRCGIVCQYGFRALSLSASRAFPQSTKNKPHTSHHDSSMGMVPVCSRSAEQSRYKELACSFCKHANPLCTGVVQRAMPRVLCTKAALTPAMSTSCPGSRLSRCRQGRRCRVSCRACFRHSTLGPPR